MLVARRARDCRGAKPQDSSEDRERVFSIAAVKEGTCVSIGDRCSRPRLRGSAHENLSRMQLKESLPIQRRNRDDDDFGRTTAKARIWNVHLRESTPDSVRGMWPSQAVCVQRRSREYEEIRALETTVNKRSRELIHATTNRG